jgi:ribokinase
MTKRLLVVGSINLDLVVVAPKIPHAGETISGTSFNTFPGGKGANQAYAAARLGTPVSMIGKLGNDAFGVQLRSNLESVGVDTSAVEVVSTSSGIAQITTAENGENVIVVVAGANGHVSPADLDRHLNVIRNSSIILAQLEIPLETVAYLAELAGREGIPLVLDPAPAQPLPSPLLHSVEWLTPNESEACTLLGLSAKELTMDKLEESAELLLRHGCRNVILKLGHRGCYLALANGMRVLVPSYKVKAVDTTAAGDAFNGAFASSLVQGNDPMGSARWACAVAAVSVTRHGAQPSLPTRAEVQGFLDTKQEVEATDQLRGG